MKVESRVPLAPSFHPLVLVHTKVVEDQMDLSLGPSVLIQRAEAREEFEVAMTVVELRHDGPIDQVESDEQIDGSVPPIVVAPTFRQPRAEGKDGLASFEGLDRGLLVHREDRSVFGRVEVEAHDVDELGDEVRVATELERLHEVGLQIVSLPDAGDGHVTDSELPGEGAGAPMGRSFRSRVKGRLDNPFDHGSRDTRLPPEAWSILADPFEPQLMEPRAPASHARLGGAKSLGDLLVLPTISSQECDAGAKDQACGGGTTPSPLLELTALAIGENDWWCDPHEGEMVARTY